MKTKKLITFALLAFVAVSIGYLVLSNTGTVDSTAAGPEKAPVSGNDQKGASPGEAAGNASVPESRVVAQYFHGTMRCDTCRAIESLTMEALTSEFSDELESGKLEIRAINVDEPANWHFVEDYQLTTRTVVVALLDKGEEKEWKRLDQVWQLVRDRAAFIEYVQDETRSLLEQAS